MLDAGALEAAINDVVGRHESLRTVFAVADGEPWQRVVPAGDAVVVLQRRDAGPGEVDGLVAAAAVRPFDLSAESRCGHGFCDWRPTSTFSC